MVERDALTELRTQLDEHFRRMSDLSGVMINPTVRNESDSFLAGRLYEEEKGDRLFVVRPSHNRRSLDAFTKRTGIDFEFLLLEIHAELSAANLQILWLAYRAWVHDMVDEETVFSLVRR